MSLSRYCGFYPTTKGWYMELANEEYGTREDAATYGPAPTSYQANMMLDGHSNPGGSDHETALQPVPTVSPNGDPIQPADLWNVDRSGYGEDTERFVSTWAQRVGHTIYDSATDLIFTVDTNGVLTEVRSHDFWGYAPATAIGKPAPRTAADWEAVAAFYVRLMLAKGHQYDPVIIPGLAMQPLTPDALAAL